MSEERKKVTTDQLKILIEELEGDRMLLNGRGLTYRDRLELHAKWGKVTKKLNAVDGGAYKNISKWQQSLRDWKNNTKKKAAKASEGGEELTTLEAKLMALYDKHPTAGIDISYIADMDPLSSDENGEGETYPEMLTSYNNEVNNDTYSHTILNRLTRLEASKIESEAKRNNLLEAFANSLDRNTAATESLARAAEAQTMLLKQILDVLVENKKEG